MNLSLEELSKISHLKCEELHGRAIPLLPLWDGSEWHMWIPTQERGLIKMKPIDVGEGDCFAKAPAKESDLYIPFFEFMLKRAYWPELSSKIRGIASDVQNLGTSLAKIDMFYAHREKLSLGASDFVATELEYILLVCRSLFDLLQEVIARIWKNVKLFDTSVQKRDLRPSFRQMVIESNQLRTLSQIQERYGLPEELARFYFEAGPFFQQLRSGRDAIAHHGKDIGTIFVTERGFALARTEEPFASFGVWREEHYFNEKLASLRPILAHVIFTTIFTCNSFVEAVSRVIAFPPDIAPDYHVFRRGSNNEALVASLGVLRGENPWWAQ